jgi:3-dehydroquinate synthase
MLKHGLIYDKNYWQKFSDIKNINFTEFDQLIYRSIEIKNQIVTLDPNDFGIRKALNFGHTLGHAIESYFLTTKTPLLHGEAIAIGMVMEAFISKEKKLLSSAEFEEIKTVLSSIYDTVNIDKIAQKSSIEMLIHDKKNEFGNVQFTLLNSIGEFIINQSVDNELIEDSFLAYKSK